MKMPVWFVGHGSPMNAIAQNEITQQWQKVAQSFAKPRAILAISAHWYGNETAVQMQEQPEQVYDMYGFPEALYALRYQPKGDKALAQQVHQLLGAKMVDNQWGIDHGIWSILCHCYPEADVPVVQLSINRRLSPAQMFELGQRLAPLREQGVLILGSGNVVHNLGLLNWQARHSGADWAVDFDQWVCEQIRQQHWEALFDYAQQPSARLSVPTPEHLAPLFYCAGASHLQDQLQVSNQVYVMNSLSMTSYLWH